MPHSVFYVQIVVFVRVEAVKGFVLFLKDCLYRSWDYWGCGSMKAMPLCRYLMCKYVNGRKQTCVCVCVQVCVCVCACVCTDCWGHSSMKFMQLCRYVICTYVNGPRQRCDYVCQRCDYVCVFAKCWGRGLIKAILFWIDVICTHVNRWRQRCVYVSVHVCVRTSWVAAWWGLFRCAVILYVYLYKRV